MKISKCIAIGECFVCPFQNSNWKTNDVSDFKWWCQVYEREIKPMDNYTKPKYCKVEAVEFIALKHKGKV